MRNRMLMIVVVVFGVVISGTGCAFAGSLPQKPPSFVETMEPSWTSIELREGVTYEKAWAMVVDLLTKRFDMAILSKESGYARTTWLHTWTGKMRDDYKVRVTIKFSVDKSKVEIKSEANYLLSGRWVAGTDTDLLKTLKTDIMGTVGRTTR